MTRTWHYLRSWLSYTLSVWLCGQVHASALTDSTAENYFERIVQRRLDGLCLSRSTPDTPATNTLLDSCFEKRKNEANENKHDMYQLFFVLFQPACYYCGCGIHYRTAHNTAEQKMYSKREKSVWATNVMFLMVYFWCCAYATELDTIITAVRIDSWRNFSFFEMMEFAQTLTNKHT